MSDPRPHRRLRLGGRRADGPPRDRPPARRTNRRSTSATTPARRTGRAPTTRSWRSRRRPSTRSSSATSRRSSSPATPPPPSGSARSGGATTCPSSASSGRCLGGRPGDPQPPGRGHRDAGDDPLARLLRGDQGREPGDRGLRARHAALVPMVEAGVLTGPSRRGDRRRCAGAAARRPRRGRRVDLPAAAGRDHRHAPARLHPLPAAPAAHRRGAWASASRSSTPPRRRRRRWPSSSASNGLEAPGTSRTRGRRRPPRIASSRPATPPPFHDLAQRLFGSAFPDVETVDLGSAGAMTGGIGGRGARRDDRVWQAGFLIGSALGAAATVVGRRASARRARASSTGRPSSGSPIGRLAAGARRADRGRAARGRAGLRRGDGPDRAGPLGGPRDRAAGRRRAVGGRRPGRLGPGQHRRLRVAHRQARGRPARPGRAARRRAGQGDDGPGQPLDHDPPARVPARVHGPARPRPVRPRPAVGRGRPGPAAVRRGEHPRHGRARWACRSARSGPGSRCTRRPTPSSSRRTPGCGRTSRRGWSGS